MSDDCGCTETRCCYDHCVCDEHCSATSDSNGYCEYCWADYGPNFEITHNVPPGKRCWGEA